MVEANTNNITNTSKLNNPAPIAPDNPGTLTKSNITGTSQQINTTSSPSSIVQPQQQPSQLN